MTTPRSWTAWAALPALALLALAALPRPALAGLAPTEEPADVSPGPTARATDPEPASHDLLPGPELRLTPPLALLVAAAPTPASPAPATHKAAPAKPLDASLDFDLLGAPAKPQLKFDDAAMKKRRSMLDFHQKLGFGLVGLQLATTVVGQLNYTDKYGSNPPVTGQYELTHTVLAYSTLAVFAVNGAVALLTPPNPVKKEQYDRMTVHKVGMALATAGMIAQGVVGIYADQQEGRVDQGQIAKTHLVIGYATLAAVAVAVGALVF